MPRFSHRGGQTGKPGGLRGYPGPSAGYGAGGEPERDRAISERQARLTAFELYGVTVPDDAFDQLESAVQAARETADRFDCWLELPGGEIVRASELPIAAQLRATPRPDLGDPNGGDGPPDLYGMHQGDAPDPDQDDEPEVGPWEDLHGEQGRLQDLQDREDEQRG